MSTENAGTKTISVKRQKSAFIISLPRDWEHRSRVYMTKTHSLVFHPYVRYRFEYNNVNDRWADHRTSSSVWVVGTDDACQPMTNMTPKVFVWCCLLGLPAVWIVPAVLPSKVVRPIPNQPGGLRTPQSHCTVRNIWPVPRIAGSSSVW